MTVNVIETVIKKKNRNRLSQHLFIFWMFYLTFIYLVPCNCVFMTNMCILYYKVIYLFIDVFVYCGNKEK